MDYNKLMEIIEYTRGTCQSLDEVLEKFDESFDELTMEDAEIIDENIFCCGNCGWWCETSEMADDWEDHHDEPCCEDCVRYELSE